MIDDFNEEERSILMSFMLLMGISLLLGIMLAMQQSPGDGGIGIAIGMIILTTVSGLAVSFLSFLLAINTIIKYGKITQWWIKFLGFTPIIIASLTIGTLFMNGSISL